MIPATTIIMPVHNRLKLTEQTFFTLKENTYPNYRLIIMADNVDSEMRAFLDSTRAEIYYVNFGQHIDSQVGQSVGQDLLRAMAISVTDTPFIYFTDNDIYFLPNWLEKLHEIYAAIPNAGIVGGRTSHLHSEIAREKTYKLTSQQSGYSMLMSKAVWNKCGIYRHRFDDVGLCNSVLKHGYAIAQPLEPVLYHCGLTRSDGLKVIGYDEEKNQPFPKGCIVL